MIEMLDQYDTYFEQFLDSQITNIQDLGIKFALIRWVLIENRKTLFETVSKILPKKLSEITKPLQALINKTLAKKVYKTHKPFNQLITNYITLLAQKKNQSFIFDFVENVIRYNAFKFQDAALKLLPKQNIEINKQGMDLAQVLISKGLHPIKAVRPFVQTYLKKIASTGTDVFKYRVIIDIIKSKATDLEKEVLTLLPTITLNMDDHDNRTSSENFVKTIIKRRKQLPSQLKQSLISMAKKIIEKVAKSPRKEKLLQRLTPPLQEQLTEKMKQLKVAEEKRFLE